MTTSAVLPYKGNPTLHINGRPVAAVAAYVKPPHVPRMLESGVRLYTTLFSVKWWVGPDTYDFSALDEQMAAYAAAIPNGYLMPRIDLAPAGFPWWGEQNPDEMVVMRNIETGEIMDPAESDPRGEEHLHHGVHLQKLNLHSFSSLKWRDDAGRALAAMVRHTEQQPWADRVMGWMVCDGWPQEWFHWGEYLLSGLEDYSPAEQAGFRRWLREVYADDAALQAAWGQPVTLESAQVPEPWTRVRPSHGEFFDPRADRAVVDYTQYISDSMVDSIIAVCQAAKDAMREPKIVTAFYGYPFCHLPRPQLIGHNALERLLGSPAVDATASPHSYDNRGYGGYHAPQAMADTARRAGKIHWDEVDCKTIWTAKTRWKDNISEPPDLWSTLEMMKKDAAYQAISASAMWWCDLFHTGWYDAPECVEPIRKLREIAEAMQERGPSAFGEIALVVSERSQAFQSAKDGLIDATREMFRNWYLSRMGAPFEQLLLSDLGRPGVPKYKLYLFADLFHVSAEERDLIRRTLAGSGATALWIYAPGFLADDGASVDNMQALTGIRFARHDLLDELNVRVDITEHALLAGVEAGLRYGTGVDRDQYRRAPSIQYLPDTRVAPAFSADDPGATVLGAAESTGNPGLVVKEMDGWRSVYSAAPLFDWRILRNLAGWAGAHVYDTTGDMLWGNDHLLVIYAQSAGPRQIALPRALTVRDAWTNEVLGEGVQSLVLNMQRFETRLLWME